MSYKLLKVIFVILLVVTVFEAGYYFLVLNKTKVTADAQILTNETNDLLSKIQIEASPTPLLSADALLSPDNLNFLLNLKKTTNQTVYLTTKTSGFVGELSESAGKSSYILKIVDDQGQKVINYVLDKKNSSDRKLYLVENDLRAEIKIEEIRTGDKIAVEDEHELRDNIISVNFIIYR